MLEPWLVAARIRYVVRASLWVPVAPPGIVVDTGGRRVVSCSGKQMRMRGFGVLAVPQLDKLPGLRIPQGWAIALWGALRSSSARAAVTCAATRSGRARNSRAAAATACWRRTVRSVARAAWSLPASALWMHGQSSHAWRPMPGKRSAGSMCPDCRRDFHVRPRLVRHLTPGQGRQRCCGAFHAAAPGLSAPVHDLVWLCRQLLRIGPRECVSACVCVRARTRASAMCKTRVGVSCWHNRHMWGEGLQ